MIPGQRDTPGGADKFDDEHYPAYTMARAALAAAESVRVVETIVTRSPGHPVTRSPGHPVTRSPGHPVTRSRGPVTVVSKADVRQRYATWVRDVAPSVTATKDTTRLAASPTSNTGFADEIEVAVAGLWRDVLGIVQALMQPGGFLLWLVVGLKAEILRR